MNIVETNCELKEEMKLDSKCIECGYQFNSVHLYKCPLCDCKTDRDPPYSPKDYEEAKRQGLDLDDWNDYVIFYGIGEEETYE